MSIFFSLNAFHRYAMRKMTQRSFITQLNVITPKKIRFDTNTADTRTVNKSTHLFRLLNPNKCNIRMNDAAWFLVVQQRGSLQTRPRVVSQHFCSPGRSLSRGKKSPHLVVYLSGLQEPCFTGTKTKTLNTLAGTHETSFDRFCHCVFYFFFYLVNYWSSARVPAPIEAALLTIWAVIVVRAQFCTYPIRPIYVGALC